MLICIGAISIKSGFLSSFDKLHLYNPEALFVIGMVIVGFVICLLFNYFSGNIKTFLLKKGFVEAEGEIIAIEELGSMGKPARHILNLLLTLKVTSNIQNLFEAKVKTSVSEYGNPALSYQRRVPDYKVGEKIMVMYHSQDTTKVVIPIKGVPD